MSHDIREPKTDPIHAIGDRVNIFLTGSEEKHSGPFIVDSRSYLSGWIYFLTNPEEERPNRYVVAAEEKLRVVEE